MGRCGFTEGEAGELDESVFNSDVATARDVQRFRRYAREHIERGRIGAAEIVESFFRTEILPSATHRRSPAKAQFDVSAICRQST